MKSAGRIRLLQSDIKSSLIRHDKKILSTQPYCTRPLGGPGAWKAWKACKMEDEDSGLFNIEVSSSNESVNESEKVPRDFQSEQDFQRQRAEWKPKNEVGEVLYS
jgi:hypothetical protein